MSNFMYKYLYPVFTISNTYSAIYYVYKLTTPEATPMTAFAATLFTLAAVAGWTVVYLNVRKV